MPYLQLVTLICCDWNEDLVFRLRTLVVARKHSFLLSPDSCAKRSPFVTVEAVQTSSMWVGDWDLTLSSSSTSFVAKVRWYPYCVTFCDCTMTLTDFDEWMSRGKVEETTWFHCNKRVVDFKNSTHTHAGTTSRSLYFSCESQYEFVEGSCGVKLPKEGALFLYTHFALDKKPFEVKKKNI